MKSFAILSVLVASVCAASSSGTPTATGNPLIPTGISSGCTAYLGQLDQDKDLLACSSAITKATAAYGAGANSTSTDVTSALGTLCGSVNSACAEPTLRSKLTSFYSACGPELTNTPNKDVIRTYDTLYALYPLTQAVCSKGDSGKYCASELGSSGSNNVELATSNAGDALTDLKAISKDLFIPVSGTLSKRASSPSVQQAFYPNTTTFAQNNVLFLLLKPTLSSTQLCQTCTRNVLTSYIDFESAIPYAPGLASSPLMNGQSALYSAIQNTCGPSFLSGTVAAAGGISNGVIHDSGANALTVGVSTIFASIGAAVIAFSL